MISKKHQQQSTILTFTSKAAGKRIYSYNNTQQFT